MMLTMIPPVEQDLWSQKEANVSEDSGGPKPGGHVRMMEKPGLRSAGPSRGAELSRRSAHAARLPVNVHHLLDLLSEAAPIFQFQPGFTEPL